MPDVRPTVKDMALKSIARVRARGPHEAVALVGERLHETMSSADELLVLVRACTDETLDDDTLVVRRGTADDAELYARSIGTDSASTFARRLSADTWCYLVVDGRRLLHATWCTKTAAWTRELHTYLAPPPGDAYVYESFTRSDARGRGIYPLALRAISTDLNRELVPRVWVCVEATNQASLRAVTKAGFETRTSIRFGRRLGRVWVTRSPLRSAESLHITADPAQGGPSGG